MVTRPLTGLSPQDFVIHQHGTYFEVAGLQHGHQHKWAISRRQYQQVKSIGEMGTLGVIVGCGLFATGYALLLIRSTRQRRRLRLAQTGPLARPR
ncbi:MAG: hypothetical protein HKL95_00845 [Phycisphaerae bacterium]|nr:hypothetical protein [Phycisphaerae bacterium]